MATLNTFPCSEAFGNTGISKCSLVPALIVGMLIVPNDFVITAANAATLQDYLSTAAKDPVKSKRLFPVHNFTAFTDNSEDPVVETTGYGDPIPVRDGNYSWTFRFITGGICLLKALQKFNGQSVSVLFYDNNGLLFGANTSKGLAGVPLKSFFAQKWTPTDGSNVAGFNVNVVFDPKYINQNFGFIKDDETDYTQVVGLQDINIVAVGPQTPLLLAVSTVAGCVGDNLFDLFKDELSAGALWSVINKATGEDVVIDSVAKNEGNKTFTITLTAGVAAGSQLIVNLKPVDELEAADIIGFEGSPTLIKTA